MKKISVLLSILSLLALVSCQKGAAFPDYKEENGQIVSPDGKARYNATQMGFEPCGVGKQIGTRKEVFELYQVLDINEEPLNTDDWLTEAYAGDASTVYCRDGIIIPDFREINYEVCYVCEEDVNVISVATVDDAETVNFLISSLEGGEPMKWPVDDALGIYKLKFYSSEYPALFYSMVYCISESGNYLYDRGTDLCVEIGEILSDYVTVDTAVTQ